MAEKVKTREITVVEENGAFAAFFKKFTQDPEYDFEKMRELFSEKSVKVLVGCAPCQPFSSHTYKAKNKQSDKRWNLISYFLKAVGILNPDVISMENVRGITKTDIFKDFVNQLMKRPA